eukprot:SAG31_NODE_44613_length_262_cov_0.631902_1_plen_30_part_01
MAGRAAAAARASMGSPPRANAKAFLVTFTL